MTEIAREDVFADALKDEGGLELLVTVWDDGDVSLERSGDDPFVLRSSDLPRFVTLVSGAAALAPSGIDRAALAKQYLDAFVLHNINAGHALGSPAVFAERAVSLADALIAALKETK